MNKFKIYKNILEGPEGTRIWFRVFFSKKIKNHPENLEKSETGPVRAFPVHNPTVFRVFVCRYRTRGVNKKNMYIVFLIINALVAHKY